MAEEMNSVTPEGADLSAPSFHENIGNMNYKVVLHFAENGSQTVEDRLKRVILHEANGENGTTNH
ncbi:MAG: transposon-encoded TnpW family protein [Butyrivibrio sp.]|nr:transposon-encoded TnpW family protein [Butyrivibrio sp.]